MQKYFRFCLVLICLASEMVFARSGVSITYIIDNNFLHEIEEKAIAIATLPEGEQHGAIEIEDSRFKSSLTCRLLEEKQKQKQKCDLTVVEENPSFSYGSMNQYIIINFDFDSVKKSIEFLDKFYSSNVPFVAPQVFNSDSDSVIHCHNNQTGNRLCSLTISSEN